MKLLFAFLTIAAILSASCTKVSNKFNAARTRRVEEKYLFQPQRTTARPEMWNRRNIEVPLPDGNTLRGFAILKPDPVANILYFGGASELSQAATTRIMGWAGRYNVNVIFVDYRGYGTSSGLPAIKHLPGDALRVFDATSETRGEIPNFVIGFSIGSIPATYLAAHRPIEGLVLLAPISSFADEDMYPRKQLRAGEPWYIRPFASFLKVERDYEIPEGSEPVYQITQVSAPLLLIHGEADVAVPALCGKKVYELAPGNKSLLLIPGLGHDDLSLIDGSGADTFTAFMADCLGIEIDGSLEVITEVIGEYIIYELIDGTSNTSEESENDEHDEH